MQKSIIICLCILNGIGLFAQDFQWAVQSDGTGRVDYIDVATDASNNMLVAANFTNTVDVNPGPGILTFNSAGFDDMLLLKFSNVGTLIWAIKLGGALMDKVQSLAVDHHNNILLTGFFSGSMDSDPGPGTSILNSAGVEDVFIIKLDSNGSHVWSRRIGGSNADMSTDISIINNHDIICTGSFVNTVDFDPGAGSFLVSSLGLTDGFIEKLDSNGNFVWVKTIGSSNADAVNAIDINDSNEVYLTGYFKGSVDFDPGPGTANLSSTLSTDDVFILKLNENGIFKWVKQVGGNSVDKGEQITVDGAGHVIVSGVFNNTVDFNPSSGTDLHASNGGDDIFLMKVDSAGAYQWCNTFGGNDNETSGETAIDGSNRILFTGSFKGNVDFNPGAGTDILSSDGGTADVFIQSLQPDGSLRWVERVGGVGEDEGIGIHLSAYDQLLVSGFFQNTVDADPGAGSTLLNSTSLGDGFLLNFKPCLLYEEMVVQVACDSFLFDGTTYTSSGIYNGIFTSMEGCDSMVTLDLTVHTINIGVSQTGSLLGANQGSATYQWIWCDSMYTPIPGAFGQYYVADTNGIYAVIITDNGCTDTSLCYQVVDVGMNAYNSENNYWVYPNPFNNHLIIEHAVPLHWLNYTLYDITGKTVLQHTVLLTTSSVLDVSYLSSGVYYLKIQSERGDSFYKLIRQ